MNSCHYIPTKVMVGYEFLSLYTNQGHGGLLIPVIIYQPRSWWAMNSCHYISTKVLADYEFLVLYIG
jgi:hypothetical protein